MTTLGKDFATQYEMFDLYLSKDLQSYLDQVQFDRAFQLLQDAKASKLITQNLANHRPNFVGKPGEKLICFYYPEWIEPIQGRVLGFDMTFDIVSYHFLELRQTAESFGVNVNPLDYAFTPVLTTFVIPLSVFRYDFNSASSITVEGSCKHDSYCGDKIFHVDQDMWKEIERTAFLMKCKNEQPFKSLIGLFKSNLLFARIIEQ